MDKLLETYRINIKKNHTPFDILKYRSIYRRSFDTRTNLLNKNTIAYLFSDTISVIDFELETKEYIKEYLKFVKENDINTKIKYDTNKIRKYFISVLKKLIEIKAENINYNITDDNSIFFQALILNNKSYLELFFDEEDCETELIINIFINNKNTTFSYGGDIEDVFEKIKEYFGFENTKKYNISFEQTFFSAQNEELSQKAFAQTTL